MSPAQMHTLNRLIGEGWTNDGADDARRSDGVRCSRYYVRRAGQRLALLWDGSTVVAKGGPVVLSEGSRRR